MLEGQDQSEPNLGCFLRMYANALALPTGQSSLPVERQQKEQALVSREREPYPPSQDRKRKSQEYSEAGDDPSQQTGFGFLYMQGAVAFFQKGILNP
jgi:hypothetical protein